jgi:hypothetical protein
MRTAKLVGKGAIWMRARNARITIATHLFSSNDDNQRGAGRGECPREKGAKERLGDRWVFFEHGASVCAPVTSGRTNVAHGWRVSDAADVGEESGQTWTRAKTETERDSCALSPPRCLSRLPRAPLTHEWNESPLLLHYYYY